MNMVTEYDYDITTFKLVEGMFSKGTFTFSDRFIFEGTS